MTTKQLIAEDLPQFAPGNRHYQIGRSHVLIVKAGGELPIPVDLTSLLGGVTVEAISPIPVDIFLCDETAQLIDADGDPTNGMTALLSLPPTTTYKQALAAAKEKLSDG